ncbi:transposase [Rhodococcus opacus]|nr:transposase [Rhodococcus opacus]UZG53013.1 transposase [Rhodococcus opacus]
MAGVLAYRHDRSRSAFVFSMTDGAYNTDKLIEFLTELRAHFTGEKAIVIWDGLMAHRSKAMTAWLATQRDWLHVERLPAYAPELNPIEQVWGNMKSTVLATCAPIPRRGPHRDRVRSDSDRFELRPVSQLPRPHRAFLMIGSHPITETSLTNAGTWRRRRALHCARWPAGCVVLVCSARECGCGRNFAFGTGTGIEGQGAECSSIIESEDI